MLRLGIIPPIVNRNPRFSPPEWELAILRPPLIVTVGGLAARRLLGIPTVSECVGSQWPRRLHDVSDRPRSEHRVHVSEPVEDRYRGDHQP